MVRVVKHPMMVRSEDPFYTPDTFPTLWTPQVNEQYHNQDDIELPPVRLNVTTAKKTSALFRRWRYKTFTEKELQNQDARKGEILIPKKKTRGQKLRGYFLGTMPYWSKKVNKYPILDFFDYTLKGSGQVIFCENSISGLIILGALFVGAPWIGICSTVGLLAGTITALLLNFNKGAIRAGLFGYNALLVGAGLGTFLANGTYSGSTIVAVGIMGMFSTVIASAIGTINGTWKVPGFTLSFNFSAIIFLLGVYHFLHYALLPDVFGTFSPVHGVETSREVWSTQLLLAVLRGVSQVWFISNEYSGAMILVGMAFCSPISSFFALFGSALGCVCAVALGVDAQEIFSGLWGYNAVLGCVALGGVFYILSLKVFMLTVMCGILSTILLGTMKGLFAPLGMPAFTFPFCISAIIFILIQPAIPDIIPMPLSSITIPERHLKALKIAKQAINRMEANALLARRKRDKRERVNNLNNTTTTAATATRIDIQPLVQPLIEVITPRAEDSASSA